MPLEETMMGNIRKRVLVTDPIAPAASDILRQHAEVEVQIGLTTAELQAAIGQYHALVVRSQTSVTRQVIEAGTNLEVIGRAGVGVDNIDVDAATRCGILVINSPEGNIVSTAEHTVAILLAVARHIPRATSQLRAGVWNRSLKGTQIRGKVLGVVGLGRVGSTVADLARGLHMNVIAYDPMVSEETAEKLGIRMVDMKTLLASSDFVTVHVPLNSTTKGLIGANELRQMKPTAILLNCARGGIVDEEALYEALQQGRLAGAGVDVFTHEPAVGNILLGSEKVVVTPHLAASTSEAEIAAGIDLAEQVVAVLSGRPPKSPVNAPVISAEGMAIIDQYVRTATTLSMIAAQLFEGNVRSIGIRYEGDIAQQNTDPVKAAILNGLLGSLADERINIVNMDFVARSRGLKIMEQKEATCENYTNMLSIEIDATSGKAVVAGSSLRGSVYLLRVNDFWFEIEPADSYMLFTEHKDRPGMIGTVGTMVGNAGVNISQMQVSRGIHRGGKAMMVLCLDEAVTPELYQQLAAIPDMYKVQVVKLAR
jgi:D-3-phosphoglycerate dehydrogenase